MSDALGAIDKLSQDPVANRLARERADSLYFHRYSLDRARQAGAQKGELKGKIESLLAVLAVRGLAISDDLKTRLTGEADLAVLEHWLVRAVTASSVDEIFQG